MFFTKKIFSKIKKHKYINSSNTNKVKVYSTEYAVTKINRAFEKNKKKCRLNIKTSKIVVESLRGIGYVITIGNKKKTGKPCYVVDIQDSLNSYERTVKNTKHR